MENYRTRKEACEILGIHYVTLYRLAEKKRNRNNKNRRKTIVQRK
jgi:excisionase family DNA binding protein